MKKLFTLYAIVLLFGYGLGSFINHTLNFSAWGFNSSKYVSIWWIVMGFAATLYCMVDAMLKDEKQRVEAYNRNQ